MVHPKLLKWKTSTSPRCRNIIPSPIPNLILRRLIIPITPSIGPVIESFCFFFYYLLYLVLQYSLAGLVLDGQEETLKLTYSFRNPDLLNSLKFDSLT